MPKQAQKALFFKYFFAIFVLNKSYHPKNICLPLREISMYGTTSDCRDRKKPRSFT